MGDGCSGVTIRILQGDCRTVLKSLPDQSVHCIVTSPPYFGLRSYGVGIENGEIGCESTPDAYVAELVAVFRECRRVLRDDGTCWLNLGDSYAATTGSSGASLKSTLATKPTAAKTAAQRDIGSWKRGMGECKPKDLIGIPWLVAFALRADGWYLRSDIIWAKPNPMPESVTDRCTKSHEYLFMLTKKPRYYFDQEAVRETQSELTVRMYGHRQDGMQQRDLTKYSEGAGRRDNASLARNVTEDGKRNIRSVWTIATQPFSGSHFAVMPPDLIEPCIKAGTSEKGCCPECGAPWVRMTGRENQPEAYPDRKYDRSDPKFATKRNLGARYQAQLDANPMKTLGWSPSCSCPQHTPRPCTVLDPFFGAGTTGLVADRLQRNCIGIELNSEYAAMARKRLQGDAPLFAEVAA